MTDMEIPAEMIVSRLSQRIAELTTQLAAAQAACELLDAQLKAAKSKEVPSEA